MYGLSDVGDLWHRTMGKHLIRDLDQFSTKIDVSFYITIRHDELDGITGVHVDDLLRAGTTHDRKKSTKAHEKFETTG